MEFETGYWCTPAHVIAAAIGLTILDITFVTLRFVARKKQRQTLKVDDWIVVPATLFTLGISICMVYGVSQKAVAYPYEIPPEDEGNGLLVTTRQISLAGQIQWSYYLILPLALGCTKMSFLFFYRRVFAIDRTGATNIFLVGMIILIIMWATAFFLTSLFQCKLDFSAAWTSPIAELEHCISQVKIALALTIADFITDIIILVIPIPLIWQLNLKLTKKIAVTAVFLLGAVTVAVSLLRLVMTARLLVFGFDPDTDAILLITSIQYWGLVESGVAVFAACLPTLWILMKGWSWGPVATVARNLADFSNSSLQRLRSKGSKPGTLITDSIDREYIKLAAYQQAGDLEPGSDKKDPIDHSCRMDI
ncbi:hypothetical protein F4782DRAFT_521660 [Xylaria castorea]|nr:hypothetical protein F4782DRAFT_521660 [Xylaria castorea]